MTGISGRHTARHRFLQAFCILFALLTVQSEAQEVYRASWILQDKEYGLEQELARTVITRANDWFTRDNPDAPTARLDAPVQITIVGEYNPSRGHIETHLHKLVLGTIVVAENFHQFLPPSTIDSLVRRKHFWRNETITVVNEALSPFPDQSGPIPGDREDPYEQTFTALHQRPRILLGTVENSIHVDQEFRAWSGIGFDDMGFPGFSYGTLRIGAQYNTIRLWAELPLGIGSANTGPLFARNLEGSPGAGLSFQTEHFGGSITWSDAEQAAPTLATGDTGHVLNVTSQFYGIIPVGTLPVIGGEVRIEPGFGYLQSTELHGANEDTIVTGKSRDFARLLLRVRYAALDDAGDLRRIGTLQIFGNSIGFSYHQWLSKTVGIGLSSAVHGVFGEAAPFVPAFTVFPSVTFSIW